MCIVVGEEEVGPKNKVRPKDRFFVFKIDVLGGQVVYDPSFPPGADFDSHMGGELQVF